MKSVTTALRWVFIFLVFISFRSNSQTIVFVDQAATGANDGSSWADAFTDLQSGIDEATLSASSSTPSEVWVRSGTYYPTLTTDVAISIALKNNVELLGGFSGTETMRSQRDFRSNITILSGNIGSAADSLDNSNVIITVGSDISDRALIDGFHLEGAYNTSIQSGAIHYLSAPASLEIYNCTFRNNYGLLGAAISGFSGTATSGLEIVNSSFINNGAITGGVTSAVFVKADATISNCLFARNKSNNGSGLNIFQGAAGITNCTFFQNQASSGSGITLDQVTSAAVINCIFWGNSGAPILSNNAGFLNITNNLIEGGFTGSTNTLDADPLFLDEGNLDLAIEYCSPAVDQGVNTAAAEDLAGNPRAFNGATDLGAFESQVTPLSFSAAEIQNVSCANGADGQIAVQGAGGSGPLEYNINGSSFSTSSTFTNLDDGDYSITIRDTGNGCEYFESFTIDEPDPLGLTTTLTSVTCNGDTDAVLDVFPSGGSTPYQLSLDGGSTFIPVQFTTTLEVQNLAPGLLDLLLVDANNCTFSTTLTVTEPAAISGTASITGVTCNGESDGSVTMTASGGTGALRYSLSGFASGNQSSPVFENLSAGNYTVSIRDVNLCQIDIPISVAEPSPLVLTENFTVDVSCNGGNDGSFEYVGSGGTAPYTYSLDGITFQTSSVVEGLAAGSYEITAKDANECTVMENVTIGEPSAIAATATSNETSSCGAADGSIEVTPQGGTPPYVYQIDGSAFVASNLFSGLPSGTYTIRVVDDKGCDFTLMETVTDPGIATVTVETTSLTCNGDDSGSITVTTSGGTAPFTYTLDGGTPQSASTFSGLSAGTYTIEVLESNGCSQTFPVTIAEPAALSLATSAMDLSCFQGGNGSIDITASGGTGSLLYSIDGTNFQSESSFSNLAAGNYTVYVRDQNSCELTDMLSLSEPTELAPSATVANASCNGQNDGSIAISTTGGTSPYEYSLDGTKFQQPAEFTGLGAGEYSITVRDTNGCERELDATVGNQITVSAITSGSDPLCFEEPSGEVVLSVSGGSAPYSYQLIDGSGTTQDSPVFSGLAAGTYDFVVTDSNGCEATSAISITDPDQLEIAITPTGSKAFSVSASGGTSPYEYSSDGTNFQTSGAFTDLEVGSFTFTVRDANGCLTSSEPFEVVLGITSPNVSIYPNPVSGILNIEGLDFDRAILMDLIGRELLRTEVNTIDTEVLDPGIYILKVLKSGVVKHEQRLMIN